MIENENCQVQAYGNKIIINPKNNPTVFSGETRNTHTAHDLNKFNYN